MAIRSVRDWRGIKHQLSEYCTEDLYSLLFNAEDTEKSVERFIGSVNNELRQRGHQVSGQRVEVRAATSQGQI